ncbi:hypothetical protein HYDPIDRAFT_184390 [Hydnomerulius pinastri MD-312]|nr:hypothetical protein HYDPIDRAFT_184390 [Hydnomerulius pinastri MD-312]
MEAVWKDVCDHPRVIGLKPVPNSASPDVQVHQLFRHLSVRIWGGQLEDMQSYHFDFVQPATGRPVNLSEGWKIYVLPGPHSRVTLGAAPQFVYMPDGSRLEMKSVEEACGIKRSDILPGEEKYIAKEGTGFQVLSPQGEFAEFRLPLRLPVGWDPSQAMVYPSST